MSFRTAYGNIGSEDGWRMCNDDECDTGMIPQTGVSIPIRSGVPNTILKAFAARFQQLIEPLDQSQCGGWTNTNDVATSNHLAGTAMDLNWRQHPFQTRGTFGGQLPTLRGLLNEFRGCVWWGGDWQSPIDEMHFQLNYPEGKLAGGSFTVAVDQRLVDLANDLQNGYLGIWQPADPNVFPLPTGYFYGPFDGPEQCISGEYPGEPQTWRDGLGRWQETLGLPVTKKWNDNRTPQAATTLQQQKRWPPTAEVGAGTVHEGEWDAVVKEGWRLPDGWNPDTILVGGSPDTTDFPLPQDYFWGPLNGPDECISGEYPGEPQAWRDGLGRWQATLGLPVTKKWDDGTTAQAATALQSAKNWPPTLDIGFGTIHQGEWDAVMKEGWQLPVASDPPPAPDANDFPLPQGYFWGPLNGPDQCISGQYPGELPAWLDGLGRWQATLGLPVTKKWDDGTTPQAATTLQQAQHWPATPGVGFGTIHQGEWDAVMRGAWRLPDDWDPSKVSPGGLASSAAAIPVNEVTFERGAFVRGKDAYLGYLASALDVMGITDDFAKNNWTQGVLTAAGRESSYNPDAGNDWDVNANGPRLCDGFRANCSRGVLQTIPSTFASFHQPGTSTNIYDPVANTAAAMNYVMKRYGVLRDGSNLTRSVCQFNENCGPCGY
jgi:hypothetical protein